jgi:hypothetical protein
MRVTAPPHAPTRLTWPAYPRSCGPSSRQSPATACHAATCRSNRRSSVSGPSPRYGVGRQPARRERLIPGPGKPKTCAEAPPQRFVRAGASAGPSSERGTHNRGKRADQRISAGRNPVSAAGADQETSRAPLTASHATVPR